MWTDFHTHKTPLAGVTALVSAEKRPADTPFWSYQNLGKELDTAEPPTGAAAIGEIGLDRRWPLPVAVQIQMLKPHLQLAQKMALPVVVHCVRMYPELNGVLKYFSGRILHHRFQGSVQELANQLKLGRYISISPKELKRGYLAFFAENRHFLPQLALESDEIPVDWPEFYRLAAVELRMSVMDLQILMQQNFQEFLDL